MSKYFGLPSRKEIIAYAKEESGHTPNRDPRMSSEDWQQRLQLFTGYALGALWMRDAALAARKAGAKRRVPAKQNRATASLKGSGRKAATPRKK